MQLKLIFYWDIQYIDICFTAFPFFTLGYIYKNIGINKTILKFTHNKTKYVLLLFSIVSNIILNYISLVYSDNRFDMFHMTYGLVPISYFAAVFGIVAVVIISKQIELKSIKYIGENSLIYFAWHQTIILPIIDSIITKSGLYSLHENYWLILIEFIRFIFIIITLTLINELIKRTKLKFIISR